MRLSLLLLPFGLLLCACGFTNQVVRTEKGISSQSPPPSSSPQAQQQPPQPQPAPPGPVTPPVATGNTGANDAAMQILRQKFIAATPASQAQLTANVWTCNGRNIGTGGTVGNVSDRYTFSVIDGLVYMRLYSTDSPVIMSGSTYVTQEASANDYLRITSSGSLIWEADVAATIASPTEQAVADPSLQIVGYWLCGHG